MVIEQSVSDPTIVNLLQEVYQTPDVRKPLLAKLEEELSGRCVLSFFTSFNQPVMIDDGDADIIEGVLQKSDLARGLTMIINSPGGDGLAAERIVNVCRSYSQDKFEIIIPKMAKSAATMIAFGAQKIWLSETSELGPIDPQVLIGKRGVSAHSIVASYEDLLRQAVKTKGNIEPYLQQLMRYDAAEVKRLRVSQRLSESIAITALQTGMLKDKSEQEIRGCIKPFIDPEVTSAHGRRIGIVTAGGCGLSIGTIALDSTLWATLWELYVRTDYLVSTSMRFSKVVETKDHHFHAGAVKGEEESHGKTE